MSFRFSITIDQGCWTMDVGCVCVCVCGVRCMRCEFEFELYSIVQNIFYHFCMRPTKLNDRFIISYSWEEKTNKQQHWIFKIKLGKKRNYFFKCYMTNDCSETSSKRGLSFWLLTKLYYEIPNIESNRTMVLDKHDISNGSSKWSQNEAETGRLMVT